LKQINLASFPIEYAEQFYKDTLKRKDDNLNKFAIFQNYSVGAICACLEAKKNGVEKSERLYIMTLAVFAAYRGCGIGTQLLQSTLDYIQRNLPQVDEILLHVHVANTTAIKFYTEKFGFIQGPIIMNYYKSCSPPHCYVLYKTIHRQEDSHGDANIR